MYLGYHLAPLRHTRETEGQNIKREKRNDVKRGRIKVGVNKERDGPGRDFPKPLLTLTIPQHRDYLLKDYVSMPKTQ